MYGVPAVGRSIVRLLPEMQGRSHGDLKAYFCNSYFYFRKTLIQ